MTREDWLVRFTNAARPKFAEIGSPIPENVRTSVGFPSAGMKGKAIGECWGAGASKDGTFEIFLHPGRADTAEVAATLTHELVHAAVGLDAKHGPRFRKAAVALGLTGKMTATTHGPDWFAWAQPIIDEIGPLPHAALEGRVSSSRGPAQKNRHLKLTCNACGISLRGTRKQIESAAYLQCVNPECDGEMEIE